MNPVFAAAFAVPLLILLAVAHQIAIAIGADTAPVFVTTAWLTVTTVMWAWGWIKTEVSWTIAIPVYGIFAWPCVFSVLNNLAAKAADSFTYRGDGLPWYGTVWFQGGIELLFIGWACAAVFHRIRA